jgi:hypothetical protein
MFRQTVIPPTVFRLGMFRLVMIHLAMFRLVMIHLAMFRPNVLRQ